MINKKHRLIAIVGPTASGKSGLAIKLAKKFKGEIINADSRQIYKFMNIGTAKDPDDNPNDEFYTVEGIRHHLIDFIEPDKIFSVAEFQKLAWQKIKEIESRGKLPFLVGGTGLWIDAVCNPNYVFNEDQADWNLRKELEKKTIKELFEILWNANQEVASKLNHSDKNNPIRLIRLIEKETKSRLIRGGNGGLDNINTNNDSRCPPDKGELKGVNYKEKLKEFKYIPYNKSLSIRAKELRKNPTPAEELFWFEIIKKQNSQYKFHRQKPLLNYIVDFYCPKLMLVIEIDGDVHGFQEEYDKKRDADLNANGITILRYENNYILNTNPNDIATDLLTKINQLKTTLSATPLSEGITPLYLSPTITFEQLEQRIYTRVDKMIKQGLIEEVKGLLEKGYNFQTPGMSGIGYKEFEEFFPSPPDKGGHSEGTGRMKTIETVANEIKLHTRQYAKRQITWFKRNKDIKYVDLDEARKFVESFISP